MWSLLPVLLPRRKSLFPALLLHAVLEQLMLEQYHLQNHVPHLSINTIIEILYTNPHVHFINFFMGFQACHIHLTTYMGDKNMFIHPKR